MSFYQSISNLYDWIFPFNPRQLEFVMQSIQKHSLEVEQILDVGCGTASLAIELVKNNFEVSAVDIDPSMIDQAKIKASREKVNINLEVAGMLDIKNHYKCNQFDLISCFGNTIVHLDKIREIEYFFRQCAVVSKPGALLLVQLINYDRILDENVSDLSTIDNEKVLFKRNYQYYPQSNKVAFNTELFSKETGNVINNSILLYPLRSKELSDLLIRSGYENISMFGGFDQSPFNRESVPLVISCVKKRNFL